MSDAMRADLLRLGEEARRIRQERGRAKTRWPEDFRAQVLEALDKGARPKEVFEATGLKQWTWQEWRKAAASFSELKVVARRKIASREVRLLTRSGTEITLPFLDVKALLREGLL